jgi:ubiquinol-cytochrome c reductase cytochrome b subunit
MIEHFKHPTAIRPGSPMPSIQLADAQLNSLAVMLLKLRPAKASFLEATPDFAAHGARVYQANQCGACHRVNGAGIQVGPGLNGLAKRRSRDWVERHFADPRKLSPGSTMPPYALKRRDLENLTTYLLSLPE